VYLRTDAELDVLLRGLVSLWSTARDAEVLVVDDGSPAEPLVDRLQAACSELGYELHRKLENTGFSSTVNVGLRRARLRERDAVLVNADVEFIDAGWLDRMRARTDTAGRPAAVVGARLLYPNGLLQHAGVFLSMVARDWYHRFQMGPSDLPEALVACRCPVTGALQLVRHETLVEVGLYDELFRLGFEDVDYCLRAFAADLECVYEPSVRAFHHESLFRGRKTPQIEAWTRESTQRMWAKWAGTDLGQWVPEAL